MDGEELWPAGVVCPLTSNAGAHSSLSGVEGCSGQLTQADGIWVCSLRRPGTSPPREVSGRSSHQRSSPATDCPTPEVTGRRLGIILIRPVPVMLSGGIGGEPTRLRGAVGPD